MSGRVVLSIPALAAEVAASNTCLQKRIDAAQKCMDALQSYCSEQQLRGAAYKSSKEYYARTHNLLLVQLIFACEETIECNNSMLVSLAQYVPYPQGLVADTHVLEAEIERRKEENIHLQRSIDECLRARMAFPLVHILPPENGLILWYRGRAKINDYVISKLQEIVNGLRAFDSECAGIYDQCSALWQKILAAIAALRDSSTWDSTTHSYIISDELTRALVKSSQLMRRIQLQKRCGAMPTDNIEVFELPSEQRLEVETILASDLGWEEKANKIRQVYESYLFEAVVDENGNNPFLEYAAMLKAIAEGDTDINIDNIERELGIILQNSSIDIRSVVRSLSDDLLRTAPQDKDPVGKIATFTKLVGTGAPADLKSHALENAIKVENPEYDFDFSIWSRKWEPNMQGDYLGNYAFGYAGASYWYETDFDDVVEAASLMSTATVAVSPKGILAALGLYVAGTISTEALRANNPDKTDAEMFCRLGAGLAQLSSDGFNLPKYIDSVSNGNWGDNERDSEIIGEGFNDYYRSYGIDKERLIEKERTLW